MAQKLKFGNGTWATKEGSTLAYNDENENYKPLPFNFERDSIATRVNKEGLIEVVGNNIPRIDYTDNKEGVLLLENSATNFITYSEDFSQSVWNKTNCTIISNNSISPNGTQNADKLVENNIINSFSNRYSTSVSYTSGLKYTISIFAKSDGRDLMIRSYNGSSDIDTIFDLSNGIILSGSTGEIKDYGNGWYRCSHTITAQSTINTAYSASFVLVNNSSISYQGDGTSGVYIWGAMLEENSVASSYIPTQGTIQTRVAETASGSGNSGVFNDSEGVLFADIAALANDSTLRKIQLNDNTANNNITIDYYLSSNSLRANLWNGSSQYSYVCTLTDVTLSTKVAFLYKSSEFKFYVNGIKVNESSSGSTFSSGTLKSLDLSTSNGSFPFYGKTKEIAYYDTVLTDLELETLTSYRTWESMVKELNLNIIHNE